MRPILLKSHFSQFCAAPLKGIMGTDQTGHLPVTSQSGHECIFVMSDMDTGCICGVPMESQSATEHVCVCDKAHHTVLAKCGFDPVSHRIGNETSETLIDAIEKKHMDCKTMPKANHRRNPAKRQFKRSRATSSPSLVGQTKSSPQMLGFHS